MNKSRFDSLIVDYFEIDSPGELFELVESLRHLINTGVLKEMSGGTCSVFEINRNQKFPADLINIPFETSDGQARYILTCETFHGKGGLFKRI